MPLLKQFNFAAKLYAKLADSLRLFETLARNYFVSHGRAVSTPSQNAGDELFRSAQQRDAARALRSQTLREAR